jgi:hypothetical protein
MLIFLSYREDFCRTTNEHEWTRMKSKNQSLPFESRLVEIQDQPYSELGYFQVV